MISEPKTLTVEESPQLTGYLVGFSNGKGTWFYTSEEPPDGTEDMAHAGELEWKSHNFPTKEQAVAFGRGFEKGKRRSPDETMGNWTRTNNHRHNFQWYRYHRGHDDWMSIWVDHLPFNGTWEVEIYPIEEGDTEIRRTTHETKEKAAQRVASLMEKYD